MKRKDDLKTRMLAVNAVAFILASICAVAVNTLIEGLATDESHQELVRTAIVGPR